MTDEEPQTAAAAIELLRDKFGAAIIEAINAGVALGAIDCKTDFVLIFGAQADGGTHYRAIFSNEPAELDEFVREWLDRTRENPEAIVTHEVAPPEIIK